MVELNIRVQKTSKGRVRCGYCHENIDSGPWVCTLCDTELHSSCYQEFGSCTTLGCAGRQSSRNRRVTEEVSSRPRWLDTVGAICFFVAFSVAGFFAISVSLVSLLLLIGMISKGETGPLVGALLIIGVANFVTWGFTVTFYRSYRRCLDNLRS